MNSRAVSDITPGEILAEEFLKPMGISQYRLARDLGVPPRRINEIVKGQRAISADTALRLRRYSRMSPQFWLNLQSHYDLEYERRRLGPRLEREVKVLEDKIPNELSALFCSRGRSPSPRPSPAGRGSIDARAALPRRVQDRRGAAKAAPSPSGRGPG